jgi:hypothetical protein
MEVLLIIIELAHIPGNVGLLGEVGIARLNCTSKHFKSVMSKLIIRAATLAYFTALGPALNLLVGGKSQIIGPTAYYCIRQDEARTALQYKVAISNDEESLRVVSYLMHRSYDMVLRLSDATTQLNFSGTLFCTYNSGNCVETVFKIMRRSPTLFNELLDQITESSSSFTGNRGTFADIEMPAVAQSVLTRAAFFETPPPFIPERLPFIPSPPYFCFYDGPEEEMPDFADQV